MFIFFSSIYLLKTYCGVIILDHCSLYIGVYLYRTCYYNGVLFVCLYWKRAIIYKHYSTAITPKGNTKAKQLKHFKFPFRSVLSLKKNIYTQNRTECLFNSIYMNTFTWLCHYLLMVRNNTTDIYSYENIKV